MIYWHEIESPVGPLLLLGTGEALTRVHFQAGPEALRPAPEWQPAAAPFARARSQLAEYFSAARRSFHLPLAPVGTPFQLQVWKALCAIPYGETVSYGDLARRLGHAGGARAVGLANGANPLPIIVPVWVLVSAPGPLTRRSI